MSNGLRSKYTVVNLLQYRSPHHDIIAFPSGEVGVRIHNPKKRVLLTAETAMPNIFVIAQAVDSCRRQGVKRIVLYLPYFPCARQDRVAVSGDSISVKVYADMLNSLELDRIIVADPHSDAVEICVDNLRVMKQDKIVRRWAFKSDIDFEKLVIVSPDAGAYKKASHLSAMTGAKLAACGKTRDPETGALSGFEVQQGHGDIMGRSLLLVDDICDGGGTFLGLADALYDLKPSSINLFVTHGLFTKGVEDLNKKFNRLITTDSTYRTKIPTGVTVFKLGEMRDELIIAD